jgi:FkbM family methyltransferase
MGKIKRTFGFLVNHPLAKRHIFRSVYQFLSWQIQSSFNRKKLFIKKFVGNTTFYARKGLAGITGNIYAGLHEFHEMVFVLHFLRPEDTFFDIGANVGSYTLLAGGICSSRCVAIEPVQSTFELLTMNIALNNLEERTRVINSAAGSSTGSLTFTACEDTTNHVVAIDENLDEYISVPVITVDLIVEDLSPALIKIDVEGYETEVLAGMANTLDDTDLKAIIIELNGSGGRYGFAEENIHKLLLSKDFKPYQYAPFERSLTEVASYGGSNTIYCRDLDFIQYRLRTAKPIKIMGELI